MAEIVKLPWLMKLTSRALSIGIGRAASITFKIDWTAWWWQRWRSHAMFQSMQGCEGDDLEWRHRRRRFYYFRIECLTFRFDAMYHSCCVALNSWMCLSGCCIHDMFTMITLFVDQSRHIGQRQRMLTLTVFNELLNCATYLLSTYVMPATFGH